MWDDDTDPFYRIKQLNDKSRFNITAEVDTTPSETMSVDEYGNFVFVEQEELELA